MLPPEQRLLACSVGDSGSRMQAPSERLHACLFSKPLAVLTFILVLNKISILCSVLSIKL